MLLSGAIGIYRVCMYGPPAHFARTFSAHSIISTFLHACAIYEIFVSDREEMNVG